MRRRRYACKMGGGGGRDTGTGDDWASKQRQTHKRSKEGRATSGSQEIPLAPLPHHTHPADGGLPGIAAQVAMRRIHTLSSLCHSVGNSTYVVSHPDASAARKLVVRVSVLAPTQSVQHSDNTSHHGDSTAQRKHARPSCQGTRRPTQACQPVTTRQPVDQLPPHPSPRLPQ